MSTVLVERDGTIAVVTVNRPEKLNALDHDTIAALRATFEELGADASARAIILTGAGEKAFIAGADIVGLSKQGVLDGKANSRHGQALTLAIENTDKPVIAAVNGFALGGGLEMALACDLRYASPNAKLGLPEVSLGIIPGYGGTQRLPRLLGTGKALELMLTGDPVTAEEALRIGLVNGVFPQGELLAGVKAVANRIVSRGRTAVAFAKQAARRGVHLPLVEGLELESDLFGMISSTDEMREGMRAFLEKRKPDWK
ncbi:MAG: enoyl-CoA hydratase-related protein [Planctomycetota bacterium]